MEDSKGDLYREDAVTKTEIETRIYDGKCYNFSLILVNELLMKQGRWTAEESMTLSDKLSREIQRTIEKFFKSSQIS